jgi:hypothetical protein
MQTLTAKTHKTALDNAVVLQAACWQANMHFHVHFDCPLTYIIIVIPRTPTVQLLLSCATSLSTLYTHARSVNCYVPQYLHMLETAISH